MCTFESFSFYPNLSGGTEEEGGSEEDREEEEEGKRRRRAERDFAFHYYAFAGAMFIHAGLDCPSAIASGSGIAKGGIRSMYDGRLEHSPFSLKHTVIVVTVIVGARRRMESKARGQKGESRTHVLAAPDRR